MEIMPILKATELISNGIGKSTELNESKFIPSLFLPKDHTTYYHYDGSLTTPGCQETVMWYILTEKLSVSEQQVNLRNKIHSINFVYIYTYIYLRLGIINEYLNKGINIKIILSFSLPYN